MNELTLEKLKEKVDVQAALITDLETFTERTHNRVNDIENIREGLRKLESEFAAEKARVHSEFRRIEAMVRDAVVDAVAKVTGEKIADALRAHIVNALKSTILVTRSASAQELRQAR